MNMNTLLLLAAVASVSATVLFKEDFSGDNFDKTWVQSTAKPSYGAAKVSAGAFFGDEEASKGLKTMQDAHNYAIGAKFDKEFSNKGKDLVVQYEVKHEQTIDCGGGYIKVLPASVDLAKFEGDSTYNIMFGPDICGATRKIHLIFGYKGQNLLWKKEPSAMSDALTHLYTLVLKPDNTYAVYVDGDKVESGSLEEDWDFLAPKEIDDPTDKKPSDWVDSPEMDDPEDSKPADWDSEPEMIADPDATQPDDWDTEEDGEWEAPMVPNPEYKGEWRAKRIPNPEYKGVWKPKQIPNPDYVADDELYLFESNAAVGFDLWQVKSGTIFDNILIADSLEDAEAYAKETFHKYKDLEKAAKDEIDAAARAEAAEAAGADEDDEEEDEDL